MTTLYRLDETLWSFPRDNKEIRILTPGFSDRSADYRLAKKAREILEANPKAPGFEYGDASTPDLLGKWQIVDCTQEEHKKLQKGSIVYKRDFTNLNVSVLKIVPDSYFQSFSLDVKKHIPWFRSNSLQKEALALPFEPGPKQFFQDGAFCDPFTKLSQLQSPDEGGVLQLAQTIIDFLF